jgi:DUF1365 family protein
MKSCIYEGQVRHRRFTPVNHAFSYRMYMMYLDLDELPTVFKSFWFWSSTGFNLAHFRRGDHMGDPREPLIESVRDKVLEQTGERPQGPIRLLTHCRYFGHGFNPVSFYYCYDRADSRVEHIVAEVNNTPWGEQYCYVLGADDNIRDQAAPGAHLQYRPDKRFHVSPFMPMNMQYDWRFSQPGERLSVHMQNFIDDAKIFDATLDLAYRPINSRNLARVLLRYPVITIKIVAAIYYQALVLFLKRVPFIDHPGSDAGRHSYKHVATHHSVNTDTAEKPVSTR